MNGLHRILGRHAIDHPIRPVGATILDLLRGLSALLVLAQHLRVLMFPPFAEGGAGGLGAQLFYFATSLGHQAVVVFFVLSGFLVGGRAAIAIAADRWTVRRYAVQRIGRIGTVLLPALIVGVMLDLLGLGWLPGISVYGAGIAGHPMLDFAVRDHLAPTVLLGNILGLQPFLVPSAGSNSVLWSLGYEVWFYALFPVLLLAATGRLGRLRTMLGLGFAGIMLGLMGPWGIAFFAIWTLGASLVVWPHADRLAGSAWSAVLMASVLVVGALLAGKIDRFADLADMILLPIAVALLIHAVLHLPGRPVVGPTGARAAQGVRRLADISFSHYLVQLPLLTLIQAGLARSGLLPLRFDPLGLGAFGLLFGLTLLYAAWFAALTERRTDDIRGWLSRRRMAAS